MINNQVLSFKAIGRIQPKGKENDIQYSLDMSGPSSEHQAKAIQYGKTLEKACNKVGSNFMGIMGPANDKYHIVVMIEAEDMTEGMRPFLETKQPEELYHIEFKFYRNVYPE